MNTQLADIAKQIIHKSNYLSLATATNDGNPWVVPLFYNFDPNNKLFYWISSKTALHSQLLLQNPRIAITIYDTTAPLSQGQGVYISGKAYAAGPGELPGVLDVYYSGKFPEKGKRTSVSMTDFIENSPRRVYIAKPERVWLLQYPQVPSSNIIDQRVQIEL